MEKCRDGEFLVTPPWSLTPSLHPCRRPCRRPCHRPPPKPPWHRRFSARGDCGARSFCRDLLHGRRLLCDFRHSRLRPPEEPHLCGCLLRERLGGLADFICLLQGSLRARRPASTALVRHSLGLLEQPLALFELPACGHAVAAVGRLHEHRSFAEELGVCLDGLLHLYGRLA